MIDMPSHMQHFFPNLPVYAIEVRDFPSQLREDAVWCADVCLRWSCGAWATEQRPCFCRYGKVILERLIDVLTHGPESQHTWVLAILQGVLEAPQLDLGPNGELLADPQLTFPVAAFLETDGGHQALQVREASL